MSRSFKWNQVHRLIFTTCRTPCPHDLSVRIDPSAAHVSCSVLLAMRQFRQWRRVRIGCVRAGVLPYHWGRGIRNTWTLWFGVAGGPSQCMRWTERQGKERDRVRLPTHVIAPDHLLQLFLLARKLPVSPHLQTSPSIADHSLHRLYLHDVLRYSSGFFLLV